MNRDVLMRHPNGFMMINRLYEVAAEQLSSEPKTADSDSKTTTKRTGLLIGTRALFSSLLIFLF